MTPYVLDARSELTEDYFLVANPPINPQKDTVVAYSRADGEAEAVVVQDGVLRQYFRDPAQPGGWGTHQLSDKHVNAMVAGVSAYDPTGMAQPYPTLKVFYTSQPSPDQPQEAKLFIASQTAPAADGKPPRFSTASVPWSSTTIDLQLSLDVDESLLVAAMQPSSSGPGPTATDARLYFWTDAHSTDHPTGTTSVTTGSLTGFPYEQPTQKFNTVGPTPRPPWSAVVARPQADKGPAGTNQPNLMLFTPFDSFTPTHATRVPSLDIWSWPVVSGQQVNEQLQHWGALADRPGAYPGPKAVLVALNVEYASTLGGLNSPTLLVSTMTALSTTRYEQRLWTISHDPSVTSYPPTDPTTAWTWTELSLPGNPSGPDPMIFTTGLRPLDASETATPGEPTPKSYLDVFMVTQDTLYVVRQAPTGSAHLDYAQPRYCPPVPLQDDVSMTSSQTGQSAGNELLLVGTNGTMQTLIKDPISGSWSDAVLHLPADKLQELASYQVHIDLTDAAGYPLANTPVTVTSSTPVVAMIDSADRTDIPSSLTLTSTATTLSTDPGGHLTLALIAQGVSAPTLTLTAADGTGLTVYPSADINAYFQGGTPLNYLAAVDPSTLSTAKTPHGDALMPGASDPEQAQAAITTMKQATSNATRQGLTSARRSSTIGRPDGQLTTRPGLSTTAAVNGVRSDINHWAHDGLHAIKKGAAKIHSVAYDIKTGIFQLAGDFEGWADKTISLVVEGIEDAAHVLHAVFNRLGAWVRDAIDWLKAEVFGTLKDTFKLAAKYETWLFGTDGLIPYLAGQVEVAKHTADDWLTSQQQHVASDFQRWRNGLDPRTTMKSLASNPAPAPQRTPPQKANRQTSSQPSPSADSPHQHGRWLYHFARWKIDRHRTLDVGTVHPEQLTTLQRTVNDALAGAAAETTRAVGGFVTFLTESIKRPDHVLALGEKALLDAVAEVVDWIFAIAHHTVDAFLDLAGAVISSLPDMMAKSPLLPLPGLKQLLELIGIEEPTLGQFLLAVLAFPAVVTYKIKHKGAGVPFDSTAVAGSRGDSDNDIEDLMLASAAGISFIWAVVDTESSLYRAARKEPPNYLAWLDFLIPAALAVFTVPDTDGKPPFHPPPTDEEHIFGYLGWTLGMGDFVIALADYIAERIVEDPAEEFANTMLWLEFCSGCFSLVFGCIQTRIDNHQKGRGYAEAVLDSLPLLAAPLLISRFVADSEGVTAGVDAAIAAGSGIASGILFAHS